MSKKLWKSARCGKWLPVVMLYQSLGCLPDNAINNVLADNIIFTAAIAIQSMTSILFNTLFPFF